MESIVGQTVSHYAFLEKLGSGGMGEIYKARDSRLNRIVAVKVLARGRTGDPQRRRRFIQEAQAASALNHPNIVTIHDILPEGDTQYMVMEHVAGQTLHKMIAGGRLPVAQVLQIATQMANALAAAHAAGIIHRDLKPANVMVTASGLVKILDFGLAKLMDPTGHLRSQDGDSNPPEEPVTLTAAPLTVEGSIMGTVNYMSPEQAEGLKVDARSDIFSFGAVLYELVTCHRAFDGDSGISTLSAVLRDEVKPIRVIAPEVPAELDDLIMGCLRKNVNDRWQSMSDVAARLNFLRTHLDSEVLAAPSSEAPLPPRPSAIAVPVPVPTAASAVPVPGPRTSGKRLILLGATCVVIMACGIAATWWEMHRPSKAPTPTPPPAQVTTVAPPATPVAPPPTPPAEPDTKTDAASQIVAAPPPSTPIVSLPTKSQPVAPPVVVNPKQQAKSQVVAAAPPVAVPVLPVPHAPGPAVVVPVTLGDGVPFRIALIDDLPLNIEVGQALQFRVLDGLTSGDVVAIAKGAIVTGSVTALGGKRNFFGERSKVRFRLISALSVDDNKINVRATPAAKTDGSETRPFATPNESSRDLKEKNLIAAGGTEYIAYVAGSQTVNVHK